MSRRSDHPATVPRSSWNPIPRRIDAFSHRRPRLRGHHRGGRVGTFRTGGTTLTRASNARGWTETAWADGGSGYSTLNAALTGAASFGTGCTKRAEADVCAVGDPNTGVAVYDSFAYQGFVGWLVFGGTSVSAPVIGGVYALAGNAASVDNNYPYTHSTNFFDVTSGSNGTCPTTQWCHARVGWDGPTGLGTPNGVGGF